MAEISTKQHAAIQALLTEQTIGDAAKAANVGERTLSRWMNEDETFQRALRAAQSTVINGIARSLSRLAESAVDALSDGLGKHEPTALRLRAAMIALDRLVRFQELTNLQQEVEDLRGLLHELDKTSVRNSED